MIERKFIKEAVKRLKTAEYVKKELGKAGIIDVNIQRTTLATRIGIKAERPGLIIGRKGKTIKDLSEEIEKKLEIENPQIEVIDIPEPSLEPGVIARWIARALERGLKAKKITERAVERVMDAGAMGVEITVAGKISGKGSKSKKQRTFKGYLKKAGDSTKFVKEAREKAILKQGIIGVVVKIVPPGTAFSDKIDIKKILGEKIGNNKEKGAQGNEQPRTE